MVQFEDARRAARGPLDEGARTNRHVLRVLLLVGILAPAPAFGADIAAVPTRQAVVPAPAAAEPALARATVRFFNRDIVTFRAAYFGSPPAERAAAAAKRIRDALAKGGPGAVQLYRTAEGVNVIIDGTLAFKILEGDLDAEDGETFDQAQTVVRRRLEEAVIAARSAWGGRELLREVGLGAAATLAVFLAVWALVRVRRWIRPRISAGVMRRLRLGVEEGAPLLRLQRALGHVIFATLLVALVEEWLRFLFGLFPYTRPWSQELTGFFGGIVGLVWDASIAAVPGLVMVVVIAGLADVICRLVRAMARSIELGRFRLPGVDADVVRPARKLAITVVWLFALALAYPYLPGSGSEAFRGLSVLVGLMLSLGASGIVGQAAGGFIITFSRALRAGEWVRIGEVEGEVVSIGTFSTKVRTFSDEEVNVPNSVVLASITRNFSRPAAAEASILETSVTIGYNAPWRQVHAMLLEAAARTAGLEREPPPQVLQTSLSDFYVQYSLRVRIKDQPRRPAVLSALNANIQDMFNEHGVQIMSPHYFSDPAAPVVVPKARWFDPPAVNPSGPRPGA